MLIRREQVVSRIRRNEKQVMSGANPMRMMKMQKKRKKPHTITNEVKKKKNFNSRKKNRRTKKGMSLPISIVVAVL